MQQTSSFRKSLLAVLVAWSCGGDAGIAPATRAPTLSLITITGAPLLAGILAQFGAVAHWSDGSTRAVTGLADWHSSDTSIATVDNAGRVSPNAAGTVVMSATYGGVTGTAQVDIAQLSSIAIGAATLVAGTNSQFTASATYANGMTAAITDLGSWQSSNQNIIIRAHGVIAALNPGPVDITVAFEGIRETVHTSVEPNPLSLLQSTIVKQFQQRFGESVPFPAIFQSAAVGRCTGGHAVTSVAYLPQSATTSRLLTLYTTADGQTVTNASSGTYFTPAGTFKVLVVVLRYPQTIGADAADRWAAAQRAINADHAAFAASRGYAAPIVVFENTNVIVDASTVADPRSLAGITAALAQIGQSTAGYDFVVSVNVDPSRSEGGFSLVQLEPTPPAFIYMGNFGQWTTTLNAPDYASIAGAVYHHEVVHHWGWPGTHDWACVTNNELYPFNFRVPAVLLGWEDLDGDGIPEILDPTPYGRLPRGSE